MNAIRSTLGQLLMQNLCQQEKSERRHKYCICGEPSRDLWFGWPRRLIFNVEIEIIMWFVLIAGRTWLVIACITFSLRQLRALHTAQLVLFLLFAFRFYDVKSYDRQRTFHSCHFVIHDSFHHTEKTSHRQYLIFPSNGRYTNTESITARHEWAKQKTRLQRIVAVSGALRSDVQSHTCINIYSNREQT